MPPRAEDTTAQQMEVQTPNWSAQLGPEVGRSHQVFHTCGSNLDTNLDPNSVKLGSSWMPSWGQVEPQVGMYETPYCKSASTTATTSFLTASTLSAERRSSGPMSMGVGRRLSKIARSVAQPDLPSRNIATESSSASCTVHVELVDNMYCSRPRAR